MMPKRILIIEPYFGGSHRQFIEGLVKYIDAETVLLDLPARKWKMRMQLSAPWFVKQISHMALSERSFDTVLLSTFVDVAVFRALVNQVQGWNRKATIATYFHENQFGYPGILAKEASHQFTAINFTTALASDAIAFNSYFNMDCFFSQCHKYIKKARDINLREEVQAIEQKSCVLYPGIDFQPIDCQSKTDTPGSMPLVIWNHRWEHDKNPGTFFNALYKLDEMGVAFRLAVLGQSFAEQPTEFEEAKKRLAHLIVHFGFVADKKRYYQLLSEGSVVVSTSHHEFFGISVLEAVRAGCVPLVPDRLSYQELFPEQYRYSDDQFIDLLKDRLINRSSLQNEQKELLTQRFSCEDLIPSYREWLRISA